VEVLALRQGSLAATLGGAFPELRDTVWQSEAAVQAAAQALTPQMTENRKRAEDLLREAMLLQMALDRGVPAAVLERLLPKRYKQYQKGEVPVLPAALTAAGRPACMPASVVGGA
jgi:MoxR-like ATPase